MCLKWNSINNVKKVSHVSLAVWRLLAGLLGRHLLGLVVLDPVEEVLPALGVLDVLDADGDALGQDPALDPLVDDDAQRVLGHVEDAPGLAVVGLVRHALLEGAVALDVDDVADLVGAQVGGEVLDALALVGAREHVSRAAAVALGVRHGVGVTVSSILQPPKMS